VPAYDTWTLKEGNARTDGHLRLLYWRHRSSRVTVNDTSSDLQALGNDRVQRRTPGLMEGILPASRTLLSHYILKVAPSPCFDVKMLL